MQEEPQVVVRVVVGARQPVWLPGKHALASFLQTIKITTERPDRPGRCPVELAARQSAQP